jgi:2-keto-3-deoxy-6-phosphogluconate aldolase
MFLETARLSDIHVRFIHLGLVAHLGHRWSITDLLEIGDALLAVPWGVLMLDPARADVAEALAQLQSRLGHSLLIGVGPTQTVAESATMLAAGAHFILTRDFDPALLHQCQRRGILCLPELLDATTAQAIYAAGCALAWLDTDQFPSGQVLTLTRQLASTFDLALLGPITSTTLADYARAGAAVVVVDGTALIGATWSMPAFITKARQVRKVWESAMCSQ